jgi:adenylate cyclase
MLEIERKFLLDRLPDIPRGADVWQIDQGYLAPPEQTAAALDVGLIAMQPAVGRIRRIVFADGSIICTHTIKTGAGLVRSETERTISIEQFEQLWPQTVGSRLRKRRHRVHHDHSVWEIDDFEDTNLVLAEIELDAPDAAVHCPPWLEAHIVREVTDDPQYTNFAIAQRIGRHQD